MQILGEGMDNKLWFLLINFSSQYSSSHPSQEQIAVHGFLEQLADSLQEPGWVKRTLSSKYQEFVLLSLISGSDRRGVDQKELVATAVVPLPFVASPSPLQEVTSLSFKGSVSFLSPSPLSFFSFSFLEGRH